MFLCQNTLSQVRHTTFHQDDPQQQSVNTQTIPFEIDFGGASSVFRSLPIASPSTSPSIIQPSVSQAQPTCSPTDTTSSRCASSTMKNFSPTESTTIPQSPLLSYDRSQFLTVFKEKLDEALKEEVVIFLGNGG